VCPALHGTGPGGVRTLPNYPSFMSGVSKWEVPSLYKFCFLGFTYYACYCVLDILFWRPVEFLAPCVRVLYICVENQW
jgi:hypothetical protein